MAVTSTWRIRNLLKLFWRLSESEKSLFSLLPLAMLQVWNQPRASTTQTTHPGHALVQWASSADHLSSTTSSRLHILKYHAGVVYDASLKKTYYISQLILWDLITLIHITIHMLLLKI